MVREKKAVMLKTLLYDFNYILISLVLCGNSMYEISVITVFKLIVRHLYSLEMFMYILKLY